MGQIIKPKLHEGPLEHTPLANSNFYTQTNKSQVLDAQNTRSAINLTNRKSMKFEELQALKKYREEGFSSPLRNQKYFDFKNDVEYNPKISQTVQCKYKQQLDVMGKFMQEKFDTISPVKRPTEVDTKWSQVLLKEMQEGLRKDDSPLKKKDNSLKYQKELVSMKVSAKIKKLQKQKE